MKIEDQIRGIETGITELMESYNFECGCSATREAVNALEEILDNLKTKKAFEGMQIVQLRKVKKGDYFRRILMGQPSKETYDKGEYCRYSKTFICSKHSDMWGDGIGLCGNTRVAIGFNY